MASSITPIATTSAVRDRVIVPVTINPTSIPTAEFGIDICSTKSGWVAVTDIKIASPLFDQVIVGDLLERINFAHVRGFTPTKIKEVLQVCHKSNAPYTLYFLRKRDEVEEISAAVSEEMVVKKSQDDTELTPPAPKRLKQSPANSTGTGNQETASLVAVSASDTSLQTPVATAALPSSTPRATASSIKPSRKNTPNTSRHVKAVELKQLITDDKAPRSNRPYVKETLARAYELHVSALQMQNMLEQDEQAKQNACLVEHLEQTITQMSTESQAILSIPEDLFNSQEVRFLQFINYMVETGEASPKRCTGSPVAILLNTWMQKQRLLKKKYDNGNKDNLGKRQIETLETDIAVLNRISFSWESEPKKTFDDYFAELQEFKRKNGHARVPRLLPDSNLGEWIHRMRKEYDDFTEGKHVYSLNAERIHALNEIGMIWKIRYGRPKKGDARYRLRRKSDGEKEESSNESAKSPTSNEQEALVNDENESPLDASTEPNELNKSGEVEKQALQSEPKAPSTGQEETDLDRKVKALTWI